MSPSKMRQKSYRQKRYRSDEPRNVMGGEMVSNYGREYTI